MSSTNTRKINKSRTILSVVPGSHPEIAHLPASVQDNTKCKEHHNHNQRDDNSNCFCLWCGGAVVAVVAPEHAIHTSRTLSTIEARVARALSRGLVATSSVAARRATVTQFAAVPPEHTVRTSRALGAIEADVACALPSSLVAACYITARQAAATRFAAIHSEHPVYTSRALSTVETDIACALP